VARLDDDHLVAERAQRVDQLLDMDILAVPRLGAMVEQDLERRHGTGRGVLVPSGRGNAVSFNQTRHMTEIPAPGQDIT